MTGRGKSIMYQVEINIKRSKNTIDSGKSTAELVKGMMERVKDMTERGVAE